MTTYAIKMTKNDAALYFAWEFGNRGAVRLMRGLAPFSADDTAQTLYRDDGRFIILTAAPLEGPFRRKKDAEGWAARARMAIAHQRGRLGQELKADVYVQ